MQFKQFALNDSAVAEFLNKNYVCTYKQVSTFRVLAREKAAKKQASTSDRTRVKRKGGNVASYFLEPGGQVLEIVLGPVSAKRLLVSAKSALELNEKLSSASDREIRHSIATQHMKAKILPECIAAYSKFRSNQMPSKTEDRDTDQTVSEQGLRNAFLANYMTIALSQGRHVSLDEQSGLPETIQPGFNTVGQTWGGYTLEERDKSTLERSLFCENLTLTEFPLVELQQIEKHVFQVLLGQPYNPVDEKYRAKLQTVKSAFDHDKGVVALLTNREPRNLHTVRQNEFVPIQKSELMKMGAIRSQCDEFCLIEVSESELFGIFNDLGISPAQGSLEHRQVKSNGRGAVLFDSSGQVRKILPGGVRPRLVSDAMKRISD